ncbi:MAG: DUF2971 domain-containing protein [Spirochaetaceae bacterium]
MAKKDIYKYFRDKNYDKVKLNLNDKNLILKDKEYIWYFLFDVTGQSSKKLESLNNLLENSNNESLVYYQLALTCEQLQNSINSYYTHNDIKEFLITSLELNPKTSVTLFYLGVYTIKIESNIIQGLTYINDAINLDNNLLERKIKYLMDNPFLYKIEDRHYSNADLEFLSLEYQKLINDNVATVRHKLQLLEISIYLENLDISKKIILDIEHIETKNVSYNYNRLYLKYYEKINNIEKAHIYLKTLSHSDQYEYYYRNNNYELAKNCIETGIHQKKIISQYRYQIADCLENLNQNIKALDIVNEILESTNIGFYVYDNISVIYAYIIKSKINMKQNDYHNAIKNSRFAYYIAKEEDIQKNHTIIKDSLYFYLNANLEASIYKINSKIKKINEINLEDIVISKDFINNIYSEEAINFSTTSKAKKLAKELLDGNDYRSECYDEIHKRLNKIENKLSTELNKKVIEISKNHNIEDTNFLNRLASSFMDLDMYEEAVKTYDKLLVNDSNNPITLNNIGVCYGILENHKLEEEYIEKSLKLGFLDTGRLTREQNKLNIEKEKLKARGIEKVELEALENSISQSYEELSESITKTQYKDFYRIGSGFTTLNRELHKFKAFDNNILDSISNDFLYFSEINQLNDPMDIPLPTMVDEGDYDLWKLKSKDIRIVALTTEQNNTLMWSHYGDSHNGICISYKITSLPNNIGWNNVKYVSPHIDKNKIIEEYGLFDAGIFVKHNSWKYENEYRLFAYKPSNPKINYNYPLKPNEKNKLIGAYITKITLGYKFPDEYIKILLPIIQSKNKTRSVFLPPIELYQTKKKKEFNLQLVTKKIY